VKVHQNEGGIEAAQSAKRLRSAGRRQYLKVPGKVGSQALRKGSVIVDNQDPRLGIHSFILRLGCGWALMETNGRAETPAEGHLRLVIVLRFHFPALHYQLQGFPEIGTGRKKSQGREFTLPWRTYSREKAGL
jgi:hypothetical protein